VISRTRDDRRLRGDASEVFEDDRDLRVRLDDRGDVEVVTCEDDELVVGRDGGDPVQLRKRVMEISDQEDANAPKLQGRNPPADILNWHTSPEPCTSRGLQAERHGVDDDR